MKWKIHRHILSSLVISAMSATGKLVKKNIETTYSGILYLTPRQYIVSKYIYFTEYVIYLLGWRPLEAKLFKLDHHPLV
jgi:hypothetical protein